MHGWRAARHPALVKERHFHLDSALEIRQGRVRLSDERRVVTRHAGAVLQTRLYDANNPVVLFVPVWLRLEAGVGERLRERSLDLCLIEAACRGLRAQLFDLRGAPGEDAQMPSRRET